MSVPSQSHGYCQANLPVVHHEPKLRSEATTDNTAWLDSASHTDTYTITPKYRASDNFVDRGHAASAIPRKDALDSVLSLKEGTELSVGGELDNTTGAQLAACVDPVQLKREVLDLGGIKTGQAQLVPLIEAIGLLLHVRGKEYSFGQEEGELTGVPAGSNYQNTLVQFSAYFDETLAALSNARVAELVELEVEDLSECFSSPSFAPKNATKWPAFSGLAAYLQEKFGHMAAMRSGEKAKQGNGRKKPVLQSAKGLKVIFKWNGGLLMGKVTEVTADPSFSLFDLKAALCNEETSLTIDSVRLSVLGSPLGFHGPAGRYDSTVDQSINVVDCGLVSGIELTLCTVGMPNSSIHY